MSESSTNNTSDSDSDDCYYSEEKLYKKEQKKCREKLQKIETKFEFLKNTFYKDKIKELEDKLLKVKLKMRLAVIVELRKFKLVNLEHNFNSEKHSIKKKYKNQSEIAYKLMHSDHNEKINQLKAALYETDIETKRWLERYIIHSRGDRKGHPYGYIEPECLPDVTTQPRINYMLEEHEILEDTIAIKNMLPPKQ